MATPHGAGAPAILQIKPQAGIWRVTLDNVFFGDYRAKQWAMIGAREKALTIRSGGGAVQIVVVSADGLVQSDELLAAL